MLAKKKMKLGIGRVVIDCSAVIWVLTGLFLNPRWCDVDNCLVFRTNACSERSYLWLKWHFGANVVRKMIIARHSHTIYGLNVYPGVKIYIIFPNNASYQSEDTNHYFSAIVHIHFGMCSCVWLLFAILNIFCLHYNSKSNNLTTWSPVGIKSLENQVQC